MIAPQNGYVSTSQQTIKKVPVLVIGGGPVGLTLAMDIASHGVETIVLEQRAAMEAPDPRCNHVSARTMEVFRRLGFAEKVRNTGLPADYPHDVSYTTSLFGYELGRVKIPSRANRFNDAGYADGGWPTPEPPHRINQYFMEPVLFKHASENVENLTIMSNFRVTDVSPSDDKVYVTGTDLVTGEASTFEAIYVAGCDGASSMVRKTLGIKLQGDDNLMHSMMASITAPDLLSKATCNPAWMYWVMNPAQAGCVIALDGKDKWVVNAFSSTQSDPDTFDWEAAVRTIIGEDVEFTIEAKKPWSGRRLVADKFSEGRVFILGDAAHNWLPMAGYGMNAGIADAANLAWKIAAVVNGWGDEKLLDTFQNERQPILGQVSSIAMNIRKKNNLKLPNYIEEDSERGQAARKEVGQFMMETDSAQFACIGLNFGYFYEQSPVIAYDTGTPPTYTLGNYTPSTCPGCRVPHTWMDDGASLFDKLGPEYTLLCLDKSIDLSMFEQVSTSMAFPLEILNLQGKANTAVFDFPLVLVRPDQHIAWRGTHLPSDIKGLLNHIRGSSAA